MKSIRDAARALCASPVATGIARGLVIGAMALAVAKVGFDWPPSGTPAPGPSRVESREVGVIADAPADVRTLLGRIVATGDAGSTGFVIVDKKDARLYVFDAGARLQGSTPVLLGGAVGDDTVPGIGTRPIAEVRPEERTTPAGRFLGQRGHNARGEDVVWVDYDAGVSMHRVLTTNPAEHRLERLATPTNADNRISYGCINVPVDFYEARVAPAFARERALVYVLPESKSMEQVFGAMWLVAAGI